MHISSADSEICHAYGSWFTETSVSVVDARAVEYMFPSLTSSMLKEGAKVYVNDVNMLTDLLFLAQIS